MDFVDELMAWAACRFAVLRFGQRRSMDFCMLRLQWTRKWGVCEHLTAEVHPIESHLCSLVPWFLPHILQTVGKLHCCMT